MSILKEYHKIDTLFRRAEDGTKRLIIGLWRDATVESVKNINWVWTEKIDGTNIRIYWDGHKVSFYGRTDDAMLPADLVNYLNGKFGTLEAEELFEQKFGDTPMMLVGEGYGRKIGKVGSKYRPNDVSFILFDVLASCSGGSSCWLKRDAIEDIAKAFCVDVVPIVGTGTLDQAVKYVMSKPKSTISESVIMEGIVVRPEVELKDRLGRRIIAKIKVCDFNEV